MTGHPTIVVESALPNLPPHGRTSGQTLDRGIYGHLSPTSGEPLPPRASTDDYRESSEPTLRMTGFGKPVVFGAYYFPIPNLTRFIWVHCPVTEEHDVYNKYAVTNLILAYAVSVKHHLREESGHKFEDLHNLLIHLPDYRPGTFHPPVGNLPLEISRHISAYTVSCRKRDQADIPTFTAMTVAISGMVDCLTLPFQLVIGMGWATIPIVAVASFTLLGIEAIGGEIENPFGYRSQRSAC
ncbi:UPF0187 protein [Batrachochytrium salamandrivorans]|nr:UPF0187 protein [Batrachochytrium salamandrivorans]